MMKPYKKLRLKLFEKGKRIQDLQELLNRSVYYIDNAINGRNNRSFNELEMYKIMEFIGEPTSKIGEFFNPNQRQGTQD